jgi:hypothetical protein
MYRAESQLKQQQKREKERLNGAINYLFPNLLPAYLAKRECMLKEYRTNKENKREDTYVDTQR